MKSTTTQMHKIRAHLKRFGKITPLDALHKYGCFRLGARIYELRNSGMAIKTTRKPGANYAVYVRS